VAFQTWSGLDRHSHCMVDHVLVWLGLGINSRGDLSNDQGFLVLFFSLSLLRSILSTLAEVAGIIEASLCPCVFLLIATSAAEAGFASSSP